MVDIRILNYEDDWGMKDATQSGYNLRGPRSARRPRQPYRQFDANRRNA
jgi:hypothetical protein